MDLKEMKWQRTDYDLSGWG